MKDWLGVLLAALDRDDFLAPAGLFIMEQRSKDVLPEHLGWELVGDKVYGESRLRLFRRNCGDEA